MTTPKPSKRDLEMIARLPLIKVVGVSGSGKSTLVEGLRGHGYNARPVSQEHSSIPNLWQQFDRPYSLIYLHVDLEAKRNRRPDITWTAEDLNLEERRLAHARDHADLRLNTSALSPHAVLELTLLYLRSTNTKHAGFALPHLPRTGSAQRPD
jgi:RNase adaptor protein for sRNA GlmZ degradation